MDSAKIADKLSLWIKQQVSSAGCRGVAVGMSGGLDSSVVAVLCRRAFPQNTLGVIMPCYSIDEDKEHALMVAEKFSIPTRTVVLDHVFDTLLKVLPPLETPASRLAQANIKTRLRMVTLYYLANQLQYLVVGSSNKSELAIGYFTKYGDGGVDIMPIGNLVKKEVIELAVFLGIPQPIIDKPPSAGLWPEQTDEGEMGITYKELDRYLLSGEATNEVRQKIETRLAGCLHKRVPPPIAEI